MGEEKFVENVRVPCTGELAVLLRSAIWLNFHQLFHRLDCSVSHSREWNVNSNDVRGIFSEQWKIILSLFNHLLHHFSFFLLYTPRHDSKLIKKQKKILRESKSDYSNEVRLVVLNCDFWFLSLLSESRVKWKKKITDWKFFDWNIFNEMKKDFCLCWFRWNVLHFFFRRSNICGTNLARRENRWIKEWRWTSVKKKKKYTDEYLFSTLLSHQQKYDDTGESFAFCIVISLPSNRIVYFNVWR